MRDDRSSDASRLLALKEEIGVCVPSATVTCGRTLEAAPDPWLAEGDVKCAGYAGREALEGALCGHWTSPVRCN
eukprot:6042139-Prymnesium_polylepis.1